MNQSKNSALLASINTLWRKPLFWIIDLVLLAAGTFAVQHWMFTPVINPNPQQKVVMHGSFPHDQDWDLKITTSVKTKILKATSANDLLFDDATANLFGGLVGLETISVIQAQQSN